MLHNYSEGITKVMRNGEKEVGFGHLDLLNQFFYGQVGRGINEDVWELRGRRWLLRTASGKELTNDINFIQRQLKTKL